MQIDNLLNDGSLGGGCCQTHVDTSFGTPLLQTVLVLAGTNTLVGVSLHDGTGLLDVELGIVVAAVNGAIQRNILGQLEGVTVVADLDNLTEAGAGRRIDGLVVVVQIGGCDLVDMYGVAAAELGIDIVVKCVFSHGLTGEILRKSGTELLAKMNSFSHSVLSFPALIRKVPFQKRRSRS